MLVEQSVQLAESVDEDGFPCEDLSALGNWLKQSLQMLFAEKGFIIEALNFSTYGASFVLLDKEGKPTAPLYNYLKPFPASLQERFYGRYGGEIVFSMHTASPVLGNLNSGLQLYRAKYENPALFARTRYALHLPQYMSYLITNRYYSDITSIGCHTGLWNFPQNHYHEWLYREGISEKLAPIFPSDQLLYSSWQGHALLTGVGLHDSSAALIPYLTNFTEPFLLISTGTWCISLNPFNQSRLTVDELKQDCLCYMEYHGKPIKASRLFAGYEHEQQVKRLAAHYLVGVDYYKTVSFDERIFQALSLEQNGDAKDHWHTAILQQSAFGNRRLEQFDSYEEAYHRLMMDLMAQQVTSANLVLKNSEVKKIFVDGGFSRNPLYMNLLAHAFPHYEIYAATIAQASAIGAALSVHNAWNRENPIPDLIELTRYSAGQLSRLKT